jgi:hypothetical protein
MVPNFLNLVHGESQEGQIPSPEKPGELLLLYFIAEAALVARDKVPRTGRLTRSSELESIRWRCKQKVVERKQLVKLFDLI